jgi:hypothetical protein
MEQSGRNRSQTVANGQASKFSALELAVMPRAS